MRFEIFNLRIWFSIIAVVALIIWTTFFQPDFSEQRNKYYKELKNTKIQSSVIGLVENDDFSSFIYLKKGHRILYNKNIDKLKTELDVGDSLFKDENSDIIYFYDNDNEIKGNLVIIPD